MIYICYPKCTTCKKAQKWLDEHGKSYELRDIKENNPTYEELREWYKKADCHLNDSSTQAAFFINQWL